MNIGERVVRHPITCYSVPPRPDFARPREGTIVYIHPQGRYHTVEFEDESGRKFRESFSKYDCGLDLSKLAPRGAKVNNTADATSGSVSFMDLYSLVTGLIGQNGRRGALMLSICSP